MQTKVITLIATIAVVLLGFGAGAAGGAPSCPQSGCEPIGKRPPSSDRRATFQLAWLGSTSGCGPETYAIVVNERRKAILC